jgi:Tfp pilus assembly protein PilF
MERIEKIKEMLQQQPTDSFLRHALALEYIKRGEDAPAKVLFESILSDDEAYIGSYYHLGKLLERMGDAPAAEAVYQKGMAVCRVAKDMHSLNELQGAYDDLTT